MHKILCILDLRRRSRRQTIAVASINNGQNIRCCLIIVALATARLGSGPTKFRPFSVNHSTSMRSSGLFGWPDQSFGPSPNQLHLQHAHDDKIQYKRQVHKKGKRTIEQRQRRPPMLKELTFMGVATTRGASGESVTANFSCMKRLSTMDSSLGTIL